MRLMLLTPPSTTTATSIMRAIPTATRIIEPLALLPHNITTFSLIALAWTMLPMPNAAIAVNPQNNTASHFWPKPRSRAYMGPPSMVPSLVLTRYLMASKPSLYFVAMPKRPVSQHHSTAPGPPSATAVATPMMFPVPMVAASDVARAANWLTSPLASLSFLTDILMAVNILRCGTRNLKVKNRWVPKSNIIMGQPHR